MAISKTRLVGKNAACSETICLTNNDGGQASGSDCTVRENHIAKSQSRPSFGTFVLAFKISRQHLGDCGFDMNFGCVEKRSGVVLGVA